MAPSAPLLLDAPPARPDEVARLDRENRVLRRLLATIPYVIFWKDERSVFEGCNEAFAKLAGVGDPANIVGKTDFDLPWTTEEASHFVRCDREVMQAGAPLLNIEETLRTSEGDETYIMTSKVPLLDERGAVTGILGIYNDITDRRRMEIALRERNEEAAQAARAKDEFLAVMSHELRTPLTLILAPLAAELARGGHPEALRRTLETAHRNALRLEDLVDDTLDLATLQAGKLKVVLEARDPGELMRALVDDVQEAASVAGIALCLHADEAVDPRAIDGEKLERIALNLVGNALKFTPANGRVDVTLALEPEALVLTVADTGIGIADAHRSLLFTRFGQVDTSSQRRRGGTGLGLALVKELAEAMGGAVTVESAVGRGSTFRVTLPARPTAEAPRALERRARHALHAGRAAFRDSVPAPPSSGALAGRPYLLVAEDSAELRAVIEDLLGAEFEVRCVADGEAALDAVSERLPDIILSDVMMPKLDGFSLLARLKAEPRTRGVPVLLLTARAGFEALAVGLDAGADDYIAKPFHPAELVSRVRAAARLHAAHRAAIASAEAIRVLERKIADTERLASLGGLLAQVAHELNNPLNVIVNNLDPVREDVLVLRAPASPEAAQAAFDDVMEAVGMAEEAARRVRELQAGLRTFLRDAEPSLQPTDVNALVLTTLGMVGASLPAGLHVSTELGELPAVALHVGRIGQVLTRLVENASAAMGEHGSLRVTTARSASRDAVEIAVEDTGPGVPDALRDRVFQPFFSTRKAAGLGLAFCRQVLTEHGGRIDLGPSAGGASFVLTLPLGGCQ